MHYFDEELVAFRDASGRARVVEAYCPHLGAHLGHGGTIVDGTLRCPFHGWRFDGEGRCVEVPYAKRIPVGARAKAYEVREVAGMIWAWFHPTGAAPDFEPPAIPEYGREGWTADWLRYDWRVKTHPQEVVENSVDWPHFQTVHGMELPERHSVRFEGPEIVWVAESSKQVSTLDGAGDSIRVVGRNPGLGTSYVRYTGMLETVILFGMTPIDREQTHLRLSVIGYQGDREDAEMASFLKAYADDQAHAVTQDFPIWEHKIFQLRPQLCDGDGEVSEFRRWASQFYVD
jgi:phenylpropionate dioxygenase-like ring-hydroxylating dioxygenase large terminal subunit